VSSRPRRGPKPDRRRALELLASCREGCTEAIMLAHGLTIPLLVELISGGLASVTVESECGAVAVGRTYLFPPLSSGGALVVQPWLRFHIPLIEPDRRISRIRLSDRTSRLHPRHVAPTADLTEGGLVVSPNENNRRIEAFHKMLGTAPKTDTNTILITHKPNIVDALGKDWFDVKEDEASLFRPENGSYKLLARVQMDEWPRIAGAAK
jgi:hypothetical protein